MINDNLQQQAQAIYRERFEEVPSEDLPSGWRVVSLGEGRSASGVAAPVWAEYISSAYRDDPPPAFENNIENITTEVICLDSGEVAGKNSECGRTAVQFYYSGTEPGRFCHIHVNSQ